MTKNLRTGIMVAAVLAGLLIGATFAIAQDTDPAPDTDSGALLEEIADDLEVEVAPLLDEIKQKAAAAIDDAVDSDTLTEEEAEAAKERLERFDLPEGFPFRPYHQFPRFDIEGFDSACLDFGAEGEDRPDDCLEIPERFPFDIHEFRFGPLPEGLDLEESWERFGGQFKTLVDDLDFDIDEFRELRESGLSPEEALEEMGIDIETVLEDARKVALDAIEELVADGTLSEETAEVIREKLEGIDFSSGFPFAPHHFDFDFGDFGEFSPHWSHHD